MPEFPVAFVRKPESGAPERQDGASASSPRFITEADYEQIVPVQVVWELTLACNLRCQHCGSRAGRRRANELSTDECLQVVQQLASLGTREVSLIGGEAYLRRDWVDIVGAIEQAGMQCTLQTGGRGLSRARLALAAKAGLAGVGVSLDGLEHLHDRLRGVSGSFGWAVETLRTAKDLGIPTSVNTSIGALTIDQLSPMLDTLVALTVTHWKVHLTVPMGNAVDNDHLMLQPYQMLDLMPLLARLHAKGLEHGLLLTPGNNIGYFGPYEHLWRVGQSVRSHWSGCEAGCTVLGLESDGTVKGCPSLETGEYGGGSVRTADIETIWRHSSRLAFRRDPTPSQLWGYCRDCYYSEVCGGGCTWTAHSTMGRPGNNPYCHHRALQLATEGVRERLVKVQDALPEPFAVGRFALVREAAEPDDEGIHQPMVPGR